MQAKQEKGGSGGQRWGRQNEVKRVGDRGGGWTND